MDIKRTIVIGDVHGCLVEFNSLLEKLNYNPNEDRVILVGDLIDRGPDSKGVLKRARQLKLECVMGNHEHKFLKWYKTFGTKVDVYDTHAHYKEFEQEDIDYIFKMPAYIQVGNFIIAHAGVKPGVPIDKQSKNDLLYLRYTDKDRKFISLKKVFTLGKETAGAYFWTEFWRGPESVIYGHNVNSFETPLIEEVSSGVTCYGIDTGCCFGGHLTALILETKEIVQVKAEKVYYQSGFD
jgi:bis(5'-nucleosyl)-tetraphosphatase (symmetrical)